MIDKVAGYAISLVSGSGLSIFTLHNIWETAFMAFVIGIFGGLGGLLVKFTADKMIKKNK